jgi:hypothetical protein
MALPPMAKTSRRSGTCAAVPRAPRAPARPCNITRTSHYGSFTMRGTGYNIMHEQRLQALRPIPESCAPAAAE